MFGADELARWQAEDPEGCRLYLAWLEAQSEARVARIRWLWGGSPLAAPPAESTVPGLEWPGELDQVCNEVQPVGPPSAPRPRYFPGRAKVAA
jgi:hypothetical protein